MHNVKCKYCGKTFDADKEESLKVNGNRYAHKACAISVNPEIEDLINLENYIKSLFHINSLSQKIKAQIEDFHNNYHYSYFNILQTLQWWFDFKKNPIEKANGGIGIVPYIYEEVMNYLKGLREKKDVVNELEIQPIKVKEITIKRPFATKTDFRKPFNLEE